MTSIFLPSSASTQISYAVKFNMADKVHRLSLAASQKEVGRHFECSVRGVPASKYLPSMRSKNFKKVGTENRGSSTSL